jgi:hypothetical protein
MSTALITALVGLLTAGRCMAKQVHQWGRFEAAFESGRDHKDAVRDVAIEVQFTGPSGKRSTRSGFWDAGRMWRALFAGRR